MRRPYKDAFLSNAEFILFLAYLALGPGAWVLAAYLMKVGRSRMMRLRDSTAVLPPEPPLISVLVPAKDEGDHIRTCVDRIAEQTYPAIEIIAINDRSTGRHRPGPRRRRGVRDATDAGRPHRRAAARLARQVPRPRRRS
jgi:cellulose synthase/poly-beta-1,6-N-acetylglucosamine synthase-like glycosyltransferase